MSVMPTFQTVTSTYPVEVVPRSKLGTRFKSTGPLVQKDASLIDKVRTTLAGEEWSIIQRALGEDPEALSLLFARDNGKLYRTAFSLLRNKEDAEDALQDGLLSAYLNLSSFQGRSRFSTWITRIVINAALMKRRKLRSLSQASLDDIVVDGTQSRGERTIDERPGPEEVCALVEIRKLVEMEMRRLSPRMRSAIQISHTEYRFQSELTEDASNNKNTTKSRASRARKRLATLLAARGVYPGTTYL
jgi:RNA polymerase sigma-70 factor (ECF subfamily)